MTKSAHHLISAPEREKAAELFRVQYQNLTNTPFSQGDTSAGMEYELQVAVAGAAENVDLPLTIQQSNYFKNIVKRSERGDCPQKIVSSLQSFLDDNASNCWQNSWVRIKTRYLSEYALQIVNHDLRSDKSRVDSPLRKDKNRFFCVHKGEQWLRLPISYILKLALADCVGSAPNLPAEFKNRCEHFQAHFTSDNTSPEIISLTIPAPRTGSIGKAAAEETARTFLFTQLLLQYSNKKFGLLKNGQSAQIYFSPLASQQQKLINELVPDSFYRQLFMSPCLSGWDKGEEKHEYMALCHRTLSRSQLNSVIKLKEAGIILNNLIVLPNTSNTCLANNGTHISLGSRQLSAAAQESGSGFTPMVEKYLGDLVIKVTEHFLPLLVATSSAAPYRIDYADFHPEKVLGFLPHELDYTHLRMLWRRWQKKADIQVFGKSLTPFGPRNIDRVLASVARTRGDLVPDFRLIDYLVGVLSTETSPALNGVMGNEYSLKRDLEEMGVFSSKMSIYLPYRLRDYATKGFSGFEGRNYSLFPSLLQDVQNATEIQNLITALAYRYVLRAELSHGDIPDTPECESERRQIFFSRAIGVPTIYVDTLSKNRFLAKILTYVENKRYSTRYTGYLRIQVKEYQLALLKMIQEDAPDLIEALGVGPSLAQLENDITDGRQSASARLVKDISQSVGDTRAPLSIPANDFNQASEAYYRNELKLFHISEGLTVLEKDLRKIGENGQKQIRDLLKTHGLSCTPTEFLSTAQKGILAESLSARDLQLLVLISATIIAGLQKP